MTLARRITEADLSHLKGLDFWASVRTGPPVKCWPWIGPTNEKGYGRYIGPMGEHKAHRVAFALEKNTSLPGVVMVCHRCDNPSCCNPEHLFLGLAADNNADSQAKGRGRAPRSIRNGNAKLTDQQVMEIKTSRISGAEMAAKFSISQALVSMIRNGKRREMVGDAGVEPATFRV